jgi:glycosyltransferase involved in cell wall biosynthesis
MYAGKKIKYKIPFRYRNLFPVHTKTVSNQVTALDQIIASKHHLVWVDFNTITIPLYVIGRLETTRELQKLGWHVTLVLGGPPGHQKVKGVDVLCLPMSGIYLLSYVVFHLQFLRIIAKNWSEIDVILFHYMSAPWIIPLRLIRNIRADKRPLLVMDTRDRDVPGSSIRARLRMLFGMLVNGMVNRWADGQTAITERMSNLVHIPKAQLWGTWPSGVNPEHFAPAQAMRRWPIIGEPIQLVYIGSLLHERNLLPMCQAVEGANTSQMRFRFSLYGDGAARADLEAFALKTAGQINVFTPVPHDQIPYILAHAHIGVTSLFFTDQELFQASSPIKLFEYMASGLPVLATRMACHSDVIGDGKYVFWVDQPDLTDFAAVLQLIWNSQTRLSEMGSQAASAVANWTWHASAVKLKEALEYGLESY